MINPIYQKGVAYQYQYKAYVYGFVFLRVLTKNEVATKADHHLRGVKGFRTHP